MGDPPERRGRRPDAERESEVKRPRSDSLHPGIVA
jgi:hypothetical protein